METSQQYVSWHDVDRAAEYLREGYSDKLFYHVFGHALDTRDKVRELGKWCAYNDQEIDFYVLDWAALGHDYGYLQYESAPPDVKSRYPTREKYAASMTGGIMAMFGAPLDAINKVKEAIGSTEVGVACTSLEGRILRQADLANVSSTNKAAFFWNTVKLYQESRMLRRRDPMTFVAHEFVQYAEMSYRLLSRYNAEDVSLGDFDKTDSGRSRFYAAASKNIAMLMPSRLQELAYAAGAGLLKNLQLR